MKLQGRVKQLTSTGVRPRGYVNFLVVQKQVSQKKVVLASKARRTVSFSLNGRFRQQRTFRKNAAMAVLRDEAAARQMSASPCSRSIAVIGGKCRE